MAARPIDQIDGFLVDLDGTTYLGDHLLPGAREFYLALRSCGKRILYITNNSSRGPEQYLAKLRAMGVPVRDGEVFTSGEATVAYLKRQGCRSVYPLATADFRRLMARAGFELVTESPEFVVLGFDTELTYQRVKKACLLLDEGARFVVSPRPSLSPPQAWGGDGEGRPSTRASCRSSSSPATPRPARSSSRRTARTTFSSR